MAVVAPIPSVSDSNATHVKAGLRRNDRTAYARSCLRDSSQRDIHVSLNDRQIRRRWTPFRLRLLSVSDKPSALTPRARRRYHRRVVMTRDARALRGWL